MPGGGQGPGEGAQQLAAFFLFVLLLVFFVMAIRIEWDRRAGKPVPEWSDVLNKRRQQRGFVPPQRSQQAPVRKDDII